MRYSVTVKQPTDDVSGLMLHELPEVPSPPNATRSTGLTLDEAREHTLTEMELGGHGLSDLSVLQDADTLAGSGATFTLSDGTVIVVELEEES
jgi:hypothetical protein